MSMLLTRHSIEAEEAAKKAKAEAEKAKKEEPKKKATVKK